MIAATSTESEYSELVSFYESIQADNTLELHSHIVEADENEEEDEVEENKTTSPQTSGKKRRHFRYTEKSEEGGSKSNEGSGRDSPEQDVPDEASNKSNDDANISPSGDAPGDSDDEFSINKKAPSINQPRASIQMKGANNSD